jgi:NhaA family Na+:H+ antiporter
LFLLLLAIVDDIGAIVVIAFFYSDSIDAVPLGVAAGILVAIYLLRQAGLRYTPIFVMLGGGLWLALHAAGIHATLAGVAMGLLAPAAPILDRQIVLSQRDELLDVWSAGAARTTTNLARQSVSQLEWLEHILHPWSSLVIVPVFALANAGVELSGDTLADATTSRVTLGVLFGLVVGKIAGILGAVALASRTRFASLPDGVTLRQVAGIGALGGIGFTVSLFITELAFDTAETIDEAKVGILAASLVASGVATLLLRGSRNE